MNEENLKEGRLQVGRFIAAAIAVFSASYLGIDLGQYIANNRLENKLTVQSVRPSDMKISMEDVLQNGEYRTIMQVGNQRYLLVKDSVHEAKLLEYTVTPPETTYVFKVKPAELNVQETR
jgi:hypothetical protein